MIETDFLTLIEKNDPQMGAPFPWALQTIQNTVAMAGMLPLRIFDADRAEKHWEKLSKEHSDIYSTWELERIAKDPVFGTQELYLNPKKYADLLFFFKKRRNSPWLTRPSYPHPLLNDFRRYIQFKVYEQIYVYRWIGHLDQEPQNPDEYFRAHNGFYVGLFKLPVPNRNLYLFAGPVVLIDEEAFAKRKPEVDQGINSINRPIESLIQNLVRTFQTASNQAQGELPAELQKIQEEVWQLLAKPRANWQKMDFEDIVHHSVLALACVFQTKWNNALRPTRTICRRVALAAWSLHSPTFFSIMDNFFEKLGRPKPKQLPQNPVCSHIVPSPDGGFWDLNAFYDERSLPLKETPWSFVISKESSLLKQEVRGLPGLTLRPMVDDHVKEIRTLNECEQNKNELSDAQRRLSRFYRNVHRRVVSLDESFTQESLLWLLQRFRQEFGLFLPPLGMLNTTNSGIENTGTDKKKPMQDLCNLIAQIVAALISADIGDVYFYNYSEEVAKLQGFYIDIGLNERVPKEEIEKILREIENIKPNDRRREQSMNYRVISNKKEGFCEAALHNGNDWIFDPPDDKLVKENCEYLRSAISVPLFVNDRIFGVLGVAGYSPYQFRSQKIEVLKRFSHLVTPYFYETLLMSCMADLTRTALHTQNQPKRDIYNQICNKFCEIFLSKAAILWMPTKDGVTIFTPGGYACGDESLREKMGQHGGNTSWEIQDPKSYHARAMNKLTHNKRTGRAQLTEDEKNDKSWRDSKPLRQWVVEKEIYEISLIPVYRPLKLVYDFSEKTDDIVVVMALYYNKGHKALSEHWKGIVDRMSDFLAILLSAMDEHHDLVARGMWIDYAAHGLPYMAMQSREQVEKLIESIEKHCLANDYENNCNVKDLLLNGEEKDTVQNGMERVKQYAKTIEERASSFFVKKFYKDFIEEDYPHIREHENLSLRQRITIDVSKLLKEAIKNYESSFIEKGIIPSQIFQEKPTPLVYAPSVIIEELFHNLFDNASRYAKKTFSIELYTQLSLECIGIKMQNGCDTLPPYQNGKWLCKKNNRGDNSQLTNGKGMGLHIARGNALYCGGYLYTDLYRQDSHQYFKTIVFLPIYWP